MDGLETDIGLDMYWIEDNAVRFFPPSLMI